MNESGEHEAAAMVTEGTEPPAPESHVEPAAESASTPTSEERAVASPSEAPSAKFELPPLRPPPRRDPVPPEAPESDTSPAARQWEDATPTRARAGTVPEQVPVWSASEVTVVAPPVASETLDLPPPRLPPIYSDEDTKTETSGTVSVPDDHRRPQKRPLPVMAATRTGIELGRPLFAIALVGAIVALGGGILGGSQLGQGALIGALAATLNFWGFTRIGTAMLSRHGVRAPWGLLAALKLVALFGGVLVILRMHLADPIAFLIGYLALPVGIVGSQLLGLQPDFDEGEGS